MITATETTTTERIENLDELAKAVTQRVSHLRTEIDEIEEQWDGLKRAGGARDDHAAQLLERLQPHLTGLAQFCATCDVQIQEHVNNPFGR